MLKSPGLVVLHPETIQGRTYHRVWLIVRPCQAAVDALPVVSATYDPPRVREQSARRAALRATLQPLLGDMRPRETRECHDALGVRWQICLSGHRRMTEQKAERYRERWIWHHRGWTELAGLQAVYCPYRKRPRWRDTRTIEIEHEKARRWDALQARKRRQREAKAKLNVPAGAQP